jgi:NAD(P)-dependent dehydrogenase (short-subunit alcohol dehydrogenase family)
MSNRDQKAIFITGSSSGLGRATAKLFAAKEWKVIASMRNPDKEKELAKTSGVTLMALDVTDPSAIERAAEQVVASGGTDVVFNNSITLAMVSRVRLKRLRMIKLCVW